MRQPVPTDAAAVHARGGALRGVGGGGGGRAREGPGAGGSDSSGRLRSRGAGTERSDELDAADAHAAGGRARPHPALAGGIGPERGQR
eukprot:6043165-Pleurochrysis_carterae.AAC.1